MAPPAFSIVIPTYNRKAQLCRAVRSCLAQSFDDFEVIIVDDGSQDGTEAAIAAFADGRIRYVWQPNAGAAAARNHGAALARGAYLAFLDSDDEFLPGKLAAFHEVLATGDDDGRTVWYSPLLFHRGSGNQLVKPGRAIAPGETVGDYLFADDGLMQTSTLVMPRALFEAVKFDARLRNLQDLDLCLRLERAGARFRMLQQPQTIWHNELTTGRIGGETAAEDTRVWADRQRGLLSERAYRGFLARYLAPRLVSRRPLRAIGIVLSALRSRAISPGRALSVLARGTAPRSYLKFRDAAVRMSSLLGRRQAG